MSELSTRVFHCVFPCKPFTDEQRKKEEEAKARVTAGKCHDIIIVLIV